MANNFNGAAVARTLFIDDDKAIRRLLLRAEARQTNH
jgi:hypothetical protein